ncbi:MAG: hypothetical protein KC421_19060, partial [Anaerolineales bacterium]|nr:hypothetical protein [Anaerolineales bacterium]
NRFNGRLDLSRVGVFGHSTGGAATIEFCTKDGRCDAGVALDSWVLPVSDNVLTDGPTQPFMFINTPRWLGERNASQGMRIFESLPNDAYNLTLAGTQHYDFTDLVLFSPMTPQLGLSGTINSQYSLSIQNRYILAFFNKYVKMMDEPLLQNSSPYPEVQITIRTLE